MTITREIRDELRSLYAAAQTAVNKRDPLNPEDIKTTFVAWQRMKAAAATNLPLLLDALDAADAERDRLRALVENAWREGYDTGSSDACAFEHGARTQSKSKSWLESEARAALGSAP